MPFRRVKCKICGETWSPRKGTIMDFYRRHAMLHGLEEPKRGENESLEEYVKRLREWKARYFEDNILIRDNSIGDM